MSGYETFKLKAGKQIKVDIDPFKPIRLKLLTGGADIFGSPMIPNRMYLLRSSLSICTLNGCTLQMQLSREYSKKLLKANRVIYDLHEQMEVDRSNAERCQKKGPVALVVGPQDAGKSTLCRSLLNLASQNGRCPLFVDLDVGQTTLSMPGTFSILPISSPESIDRGFNDDDLSVYFYGYKSPGHHTTSYYLFLNRIGQKVSNRMQRMDRTSHSGVVINSCGWVEGAGYKAILVAAASFNINLLVVVGDDNLYNKLKCDLPSGLKIFFISKLHGPTKRTPQDRIGNREQIVNEYFYGSHKSITPFVFNVSFSDIKIFTMSKPSIKIDYNELDKAREYVVPEHVPITENLINEILGISYASNVDEVSMSNVMGFICVKNVNMEEKQLTILSPQPKPLPSSFLLKGELQMKWKNENH